MLSLATILACLGRTAHPAIQPVGGVPQNTIAHTTSPCSMAMQKGNVPPAIPIRCPVTSAPNAISTIPRAWPRFMKKRASRTGAIVFPVIQAARKISPSSISEISRFVEECRSELKPSAQGVLWFHELHLSDQLLAASVSRFSLIFKKVPFRITHPLARRVPVMQLRNT